MATNVVNIANKFVKLSEGPKFDLGQIVATPGFLNKVGETTESEKNRVIAGILDKHPRGDWGDICDEDKKENDKSLKNGFRLMSVYKFADDTKFWVITEWDRSVTTLLLPEEY